MIQINESGNTYLSREGGYYLTRESYIQKEDVKDAKKGDVRYRNILTYKNIEHLQRGLKRNNDIDISIDELSLLCNNACIEESVGYGMAKATKEVAKATEAAKEKDDNSI